MHLFDALLQDDVAASQPQSIHSEEMYWNFKSILSLSYPNAWIEKMDFEGVTFDSDSP